MFYCDFGYYATLTVQQLVPLDVEFIKLPFQAIKAKLYGKRTNNAQHQIMLAFLGIKRKNTHTMEDCSFFEELVCKKCFVSVVMEYAPDSFYGCDTVLSLKLIDTSTDIDVHIDKVLVDNGKAEYTQ